MYESYSLGNSIVQCQRRKLIGIDAKVWKVVDGWGKYIDLINIHKSLIFYN